MCIDTKRVTEIKTVISYSKIHEKETNIFLTVNYDIKETYQFLRNISHRKQPTKEKILPLGTCSLEKADTFMKPDSAAKPQMLLALPSLNQKSHCWSQNKQTTQ